MNTLRNSRLLILAAGLAAAHALLAPAGVRAEPMPAVKKVTAIEGVTEYRLDNGLRVLLYPDQSTPKVTVICTVFAGSRHEGYGEAGMAHLLEHMNFKGTPAIPDVWKALLQRGAIIGVGAGKTNATTTHDRTNYYETLPATDDNLEFAIRLEADRLVNSFIRREDLISEMTVVRSEFEKAENNPVEILGQRMRAAAFEWHNYGKEVVGNRSDIERVPVDNLRAFYRKHYRPDNAMLIVAGKFDEKKALEFVARHFGPLKNPAAKLEKTYTEEPAQDGERSVVLRRVGSTGLVAAAYHIPAGAHPDFPALMVLSQLFTTQPHGRLYKEMVLSKKTSEAGAVIQAMHDPGLFFVWAAVDKGKSADEVRQPLLDAVEKLGTNKLSEAEVNHARAELTSGWERITSHEWAHALCEWASRGDWRLSYLNRDRLGQVTAEDINRVAAKYLVRNNRTVGTYVPSEKPERVDVPATPDLAAALKDYQGRKTVAAGEQFDPTPANIEKRVRRLVLPSGAKAALLPRQTRGQTVILELTLRYGNEQSLAGLTEACHFLPNLMQRGTRRHDPKSLDLMWPKLGNASISSEGGTAGMRFTINCQREHLPGVLTLLGEMLREPTLLADQFEELKRAKLEELRGKLKEPNALAALALARKLRPYAKNDIRYVPTLEEQIAAVDAVTVEHVRKLYAEQVGGESGELVVVGDFEPDATVRQMRELLNNWTTAIPYRRIASPANTAVPGSYEVIHTPDKNNAFYFAGHEFALRISDPDHVPLAVGSHILGESETSRLFTRIRGKEGLSYGVGSSYSAGVLDPEGSFAFIANCNPTNMAKVRRAMAEEIDKIVREGVTQEELDSAKKSLVARRQTFSDAEIVSVLANELVDGDGFAAFAERTRKIEALTVEQVNAAMRKHLQPKKLVIVEAGDFPKSAQSRD